MMAFRRLRERNTDLKIIREVFLLVVLLKPGVRQNVSLIQVGWHPGMNLRVPKRLGCDPA